MTFTAIESTFNPDLCALLDAAINNKTKPLAQRMTSGEWCTALLCVLIPILICLLNGSLPWQSLLLASIMAAAAAAWLTRIFVKRLGGYTGDCLGAVQQLAELGFYLGAVAALRLI